jgi:hypothetical protein
LNISEHFPLSDCDAILKYIGMSPWMGFMKNQFEEIMQSLWKKCISFFLKHSHMDNNQITPSHFQVLQLYRSPCIMERNEISIS